MNLNTHKKMNIKLINLNNNLTYLNTTLINLNKKRNSKREIEWEGVRENMREREVQKEISKGSRRDKDRIRGDKQKSRE
jgi:hypothetical protein